MFFIVNSKKKSSQLHITAMQPVQMIWLVSLLLSIAFCQFISYDEFHRDHLPQLLSLTNDSDENVILRFNKTRIPGSKESKDVQEFIINYFEKLDHEWLVDQDSFEENGFSFTNLVFSSTIAEKYIVFAVHYDSKIEPEGFIGAMDSAASCGILLYLARFIDNVYSLEQNLIDRTISAEYVGIKIVFFDGEEALKE